MTLHRITALTASGESETLEFKAITGTCREAVKTVCVFRTNAVGRRCSRSIVRCFDWTASEFDEKEEN